MKMNKLKYFLPICAMPLFVACNDDDDNSKPDEPTELSEEYYAGGLLGTVFNETSSAYEQPTPAIENAGLYASFKRGERLFENPYATTPATESPLGGLGPLYLRASCLHCHPGYGHGQRQTEYNSNTIGNGYLLVITDETDTYLSSLTGMPQTRAVAPFKAPLDEKQIRIDWLSYTDEWGNSFADGETYSLIYPVVTIPKSAYYVPLEVTKNGTTSVVPYENVVVRLESTIGVYGTGLLDAISDEDLKNQYLSEERVGVKLNPAIFANGEWVKQYANSLQGNGQQEHPLRFTYALSRGPLQDAAGANAIWNITNVTRSDRMYHYMTATYARTAAKDPDVQAEFYTYFPQYNKSGDIETDIYNYLMKPTEDEPEMTDQEYADFMAWHRGLAVPAARNVDSDDFKKGKELFTQIGCAYCHRPSWTTGDDRFTDPARFFTDGDVRLPRYPNQKIWPYTDMVQHKLHMKNDIRTGWCRTTPLWGRGLSRKCTGADDRLHDCRARNVIEAIMWHGSADSDARRSVENFRALSKEERDAIVTFIESI